MDSPSDPDFTDLEELAAEEPVDGRKPEVSFADLDALIVESTAIKAADDAAKKNLNKLRHKHYENEEERERLLAQVLEWESQRVWETTALVAVFYKTTCLACGQTTTSYAYDMWAQRHKKLSATRWVKPGQYADSSKVNAFELPKKISYIENESPMCSHCASSWGFSDVVPFGLK